MECAARALVGAKRRHLHHPLHPGLLARFEQRPRRGVVHRAEGLRASLPEDAHRVHHGIDSP
jgi:hypothetical protein